MSKISFIAHRALGKGARGKKISRNGKKIFTGTWQESFLEGRVREVTLVLI